jgi:hypothetical protein
MFPSEIAEYPATEDKALDHRDDLKFEAHTFPNHVNPPLSVEIPFCTRRLTNKR